MTEPVYENFVETLLEALAQDGVEDSDIRIQGSSVKFFSGAHKPFPKEKMDVINEYLICRPKHARDESSLQKAQFLHARLTDHWRGCTTMPSQRPFDILFKMGIHVQPSDYDVQISSKEIVTKIKDKLSSLDVDDIKINHQEYNFIQKCYIDIFFPNLTLWIDDACKILGRPVSVAAFDENGPPEIKNGPISSHFKLDDWVVLRGEIN